MSARVAEGRIGRCADALPLFVVQRSHKSRVPHSSRVLCAKNGKPQTHPRQRYNGDSIPRGLVRFQQCGVFHFVTFSCYRRQPLLTNRAGYAVFEQALERVRQRSGMVVAGYVLMPEHVHLLVNEPASGSLASAIQVLKQTVARALKRPEEAHFWQPRYYDFNVHSDAKRIEKLHCMHQNPVVRGLVTQPEDWPWSSFRHHATGNTGAIEIESRWTAFQRGNQLPEAMRYKEKES